MKLLISQLSLVLLLVSGRSGLAADPVIVDENLSFKNISGDMEYVEDADNALTIDDVRGKSPVVWTPVRATSINFGFSRSQYWLRFTLDNRGRREMRRLIEVDFPNLDLVELHVPDGRGGYRAKRTGDLLPFASREVPYRTYLFRIDQNEGPATYYLRIRCLDSINMNVNILSDEYLAKRDARDMPFYWLFFGLLATMAVLNLFIFISTRDREHICLALVAATFVLFELNYKGFGSQYLWPDAVWWTNRANPFLVSLTCFWIDFFLIEFAGVRKLSPGLFRFSFITTAAPALVIAALSLVADLQDMTIAVIFFTIYALLMVVAKAVYLSFVKRPASRQALITFIALCMVVITVPIVTLTVLGVTQPNFFSRWALQFGSSIAVILLAFGMADKINIMKKNITKAERRYRHLVESTAEIIFTLDNRNRILSMNGAVKRHLGFRPEELIGTNFVDLIQEHLNRKNDVAQQMVLEGVNDLRKSRAGTARFRTTLRDKFSHEPKEVTVSLEYNRDYRAGYAVLGKASPVIDDSLTRFLVEEECTYNLNNYLGNAELMSQRLVRNLGKFIDPLAVSDIRIALREAIINAIEHGNLCLTFRVKSEAHRDGSYFDLIRERQMDPALIEKKVRVTCSLNSERVSYLISDEGQGFDVASIENLSLDGVNAASLTHGRGLHMIRSAFDAVRFNDKGNQLLLVKYFAVTR